MGCVPSKSDISVEDEKSRQIDRELKEERAIHESTTKILLLGAGESGKTTILKQVRLLQGQKFALQEREDMRDILWQNATQSMQAILGAIIDLEMRIEDPTAKKAAQLIHTQEGPFAAQDWQTRIAPALVVLWKDPVIHQAFDRRHEFQLVDSAPYLFENLPRLMESDYLPSDQDMLRARVKTIGIQEIHFTIKSNPFRIFDVGGQKSERRKWISAFENVDVLLFVVAAVRYSHLPIDQCSFLDQSEFDQSMYEDDQVNRWVDAETLYQATVNSRWLSRSLLVLFLNKMDLFQSKIETTRMSDYFEDYPAVDNHSFSKGTLFLLKRLVAMHQNKDRRFYHHFTCATDTDRMETVLNSVIDNTIISNLKHSGFLV